MRRSHCWLFLSICCAIAQLYRTSLYNVEVWGGNIIGNSTSTGKDDTSNSTSIADELAAVLNGNNVWSPAISVAAAISSSSNASAVNNSPVASNSSVALPEETAAAVKQESSNSSVTFSEEAAAAAPQLSLLPTDTTSMNYTTFMKIHHPNYIASRNGKNKTSLSEYFPEFCADW